MPRTNTQPATFIGGSTGRWRIERIVAVIGESLAPATHLDVMSGLIFDPRGASWSLRGTPGHVRYVERAEKRTLDLVSPPLDRKEATHGVLIPIAKSDAWWALTQEERREIFETRSHHIANTLPYLPRVARRLYHARDLGEGFDFLTWFEFDPEHAGAFDDMVASLRSSEEWKFVERELEVRVHREPLR
jgi:hypothetical protein